MSTASDAGHPREGIPGISVFENIGLRITCVSKVFCHKELLLGLREGVAEEGIMGPAVPDSPTGTPKTTLAICSFLRPPRVRLLRCPSPMGRNAPEVPKDGRTRSLRAAVVKEKEQGEFLP